MGLVHELHVVVIVSEVQGIVCKQSRKTVIPRVVSYVLGCRVLAQRAKFCKMCLSNGQKL